MIAKLELVWHKLDSRLQRSGPNAILKSQNFQIFISSPSFQAGEDVKRPVGCRGASGGS